MRHAPRQADLFTADYQRAVQHDYFILPVEMIETEAMKGAVWSLDTMTPFFQIRLGNLSPLMQQATYACMHMNMRKPLSSPITQKTFCAATDSLNTVLLFKDNNQERTPQDFVSLLKRLSGAGVLRAIDSAEGIQEKNYVMANRHFEEWFRMRSAPFRLTDEQRLSSIQKRTFSPTNFTL